jgi:AcrR family transcriptional regulator
MRYIIISVVEVIYMKKKPYRNSLQTREKIRTAVLTLISEKKSFDKINVTEIVKLADITRGTFYNHYKGIQEVIIDIENLLIGSLSGLLTSLDIRKAENRSLFFDQLNSFAEKYHDSVKAVAEAVPFTLLTDFMDRLTQTITEIVSQSYPEILDREKRPITSAAILQISGGLTGAYMNYLFDYPDLTLEDIKKSGLALLELVAPIGKPLANLDTLLAPVSEAK